MLYYLLYPYPLLWLLLFSDAFAQRLLTGTSASRNDKKTIYGKNFSSYYRESFLSEKRKKKLRTNYKVQPFDEILIEFFFRPDLKKPLQT